MVYRFTFHLSDIAPYNDDHQALNALISLCYNRGYTHKVFFNRISSTDKSINVDVYRISAEDAQRFNAYTGWMVKE